MPFSQIFFSWHLPFLFNIIEQGGAEFLRAFRLVNDFQYLGQDIGQHFLIALIKRFQRIDPFQEFSQKFTLAGVRQVIRLAFWY
jgi:hypothetical protein